MGFTLRDLIGERVAETLGHYECPTGKAPFRTRDEADRRLVVINRTQRTPMRRFRCGYCDRYHLGHARGRVL